MNPASAADAMRICCVIGTRPEAIKMAPVIWELRRHRWASVTVVVTAQHRDLVDPILGHFGITADHDLDVMTQRQSLATLTARLLERLSGVLAAGEPDLVIAQGDTTTVMTAALTSFYAGIPFAHVEAGLRTGDLQQPFPEEFNRVVASRIAAFNFAPTEQARDNLLREGVEPSTIFVTGNTVVDTLQWMLARQVELGIALKPDQRLLLVTLHRRESFGQPIVGILSAVRRLIECNRDLTVLYPVHPNPQVSGPAHSILLGLERVHLCPPLSYPAMIAALQRAEFVLTDSGGIQEEAVVLGKPILVAREKTERPEAIAAGFARLVGTDPMRIYREGQRLLDRQPEPTKGLITLYGDGTAAQRIVDIIATSRARHASSLALTGTN